MVTAADLPIGPWWLTMTTDAYMRLVEDRRAAHASVWRLSDLEWHPTSRAVVLGPPLFPRISAC